jgi:hypothetical protein
MSAKPKTRSLPKVLEPDKRQKKLHAGKKTPKKTAETFEQSGKTSDEPSGKTAGRAVRVQ